jgi:hypothetical protein
MERTGGRENSLSFGQIPALGLHFHGTFREIAWDIRKNVDYNRETNQYIREKKVFIRETIFWS